MTTLQITLEYDGTAFSGWQVQPSTRTVEGVLRDAIVAVSGERPRLTAAGRTDAGAHAHGQVVGVTVRRRWKPEGFVSAVNAHLPADVVVVTAGFARDGFHARFDAQHRTYRYIVMSQPRRPALARQYAWHIGTRLDLAAMRAVAVRLQGVHDFAGFGRSPRPGGSTVRTIHSLSVRQASRPGNDAAVATLIDVTADAFLYRMMRSIAGTLVAVGSGRMTAADVEALLDAPHRRGRQATVAPAHGLHQWSVTYPEDTSGCPVNVEST